MATVLVIEDVHWADEATLDLLRFLARRLGPAATLMVITYRDDEVGPLHPVQLLAGDLASSTLVRRLRLAPLSRQAVALLAGQHGVDPEALYETTGGNPFFVTEVLAAGHEAIPATVADAVLARAARLSPPARQVLDAAAVVTPPVETWLLAEAAGAAPGQLDECVATGMLQGQAAGGVGFRHELARLAVERALGPGRRAHLHGRALAALLTQSGAAPDPARLAHHADGAGDATAVLAHAPVAARRAAALGAHREAAAQYARALRFADGLDPAALADLLERHSYECYLTDQLAEATASREQALGCWRALGDRRKEGDTLRWLSRLAWFEGRNADAKRAGRQAAELLEDLGPGPELAMAYSNLSQLSMLAGNTDEALAWGSSAIELAESLGQTEILVHALNNVGTAEMCAGWPDGQATLERSLALALADGLEEHAARAYTNLAFCALNLRDYPLTSRYLADGIRYCTGRDLDLWGLYMLVSEARVDFEQGRWAEATRTAEVVLRDPRTAPVSRINALAVVGRVRARRGDPGGVAALGRGPGAGNRDRRAATAGSGGGRSGRGGLAPRRSGRGAVGGGGRARPGQAGRGPELALADRRARLLAVAAGRARPAPDQWPPGRRG